MLDSFSFSPSIHPRPLAYSLSHRSPCFSGHSCNQREMYTCMHTHVHGSQGRFLFYTIRIIFHSLPCLTLHYSLHLLNSETLSSLQKSCQVQYKMPALYFLKKKPDPFETKLFRWPLNTLVGVSYKQVGIFGRNITEMTLGFSHAIPWWFINRIDWPLLLTFTLIA